MGKKLEALQEKFAKEEVDELNTQGEMIQQIESDLLHVRADRDRHILQVKTLSAEVEKYKEMIGTNERELALAEHKLKLSDISVTTTRSEFEEQNAMILELKNRLRDADSKIVEGEKLCKKLHNTIMELKGNIRVFCRVRPLLSDDGDGNDAKVVSFPTSMGRLGRGIDVTKNGQKHPFTYDKVFKPDDSQEDVFVEISQLVQSALDGHKVCVFAYGQTGSGKTFTMMGKPEPPDQKGLIPRSVEMIFESKQILESQKWKYKMQISMFEIYNETIRDLLKPSQTSESALKSKHFIKHDSNGNIYVYDLTFSMSVVVE
ncbi:hypothetical protein ABFS82_09G136600 [Erythranthe guttata]